MRMNSYCQFILLVWLITVGCTEPRNTKGIPVLTKEKTRKYIQQLENATYVNGRPDLVRLREYILAHPDSYKIYEWNGPGYEGFLGGLFVLHASQDVPETEQVQLKLLLDELREEYGRRQQAGPAYPPQGVGSADP